MHDLALELLIGALERAQKVARKPRGHAPSCLALSEARCARLLLAVDPSCGLVLARRRAPCTRCVAERRVLAHRIAAAREGTLKQQTFGTPPAAHENAQQHRSADGAVLGTH